MHWTDGRMCAVDVETTGINPQEARIVTASVVMVGGGEPMEEWQWLVDPGIPIPAQAAQIHGITTEYAVAEGMLPADAVREIIEVIESRPKGSPLCAFNMRYDLTVLASEADRYEVPFNTAGLLALDPFVIDKHLDKYRKGSRKLDAVCRAYGAKLEASHDSSADAVAAARCAWVLGRKGQVIRRTNTADRLREYTELCEEWDAVKDDLGLLHGAQVRWAREQAESLAEHFAKQGKAQRVQSDWPLISRPEHEPLRLPV